MTAGGEYRNQQFSNTYDFVRKVTLGKWNVENDVLDQQYAKLNKNDRKAFEEYFLDEEELDKSDRQESPEAGTEPPTKNSYGLKSATARKQPVLTISYCADTTHEKPHLSTQAVVLLSLAYLCDLSIKIHCIISIRSGGVIQNMCLALRPYIIVRILRISFNDERNQLKPAVV